jgi:hypothetical protein
MTTLREAAQQALEALEHIEHHYISLPKAGNKAVNALRAALAQEEPDLRNANPIGLTPPQKALQREQLRADALAQEEQEPVAWIHRKHYLLGHAENMPPAEKALAQGWEPLYTHPPRREWQGLTDTDIARVFRVVYGGVRFGHSEKEFAIAIETKLREKNA